MRQNAKLGSTQTEYLLLALFCIVMGPAYIQYVFQLVFPFEAQLLLVLLLRAVDPKGF